MDGITNVCDVCDVCDVCMYVMFLNVCEFEQALGVGAGQGSLAYCSPWGLKESDTTEQLN